MFILRTLLFSIVLFLFSTVFGQPPVPGAIDDFKHRPPAPEIEGYDYPVPSMPFAPNFAFAIPDFVVNEQAGNSYKYQPKVAVNHNGISFVVWADSRNGNTMCFGQIIDSSGNFIGSNFQINSYDNNRFYSYPDVAANDNGDFLVVWQDERGWINIYSQMYQEDGTPIGSELNLMDDGTYAYQYAPQVDYNNNQFVVVWRDRRNGSQYDIYGQRLDANGAKIDTNFAVNEDLQASIKYEPEVAVNENGEFLVSWYDNTSYNIYAREFFSDAIPKDTTYHVNNTGSSSYYPAIGVIDTGYVVAFYGLINGYYKIIGHTFAHGAGPIGNDFEITDSVGTFSAYFPSVESMGNNELLISWYDSRNGPFQFYGQFLDGDQKINTNFLLSDLSDTGLKYNGALAGDPNGNFIEVWLDQGTPMKYLMKARQFYSNGTPKDSTFRIDSDENSSNQFYPAIAARQDGSFITTWHDCRNRGNDIYFQQISNTGVLVDSNKHASNITTSYRPDIAIGKDDGFIITWYEYKIPQYEIFAQRFDVNGVSLGDPFLVSTTNIGTHCYYPSIDSNQSGEFVITWYKYVGGYYKIFAQRFTENGDSVGSNIMVNSDSTNSSNYYPRVGIDSTGAFAVVWYTNALSPNSNYDILMQRFDSSATPIGDNFIVNDDTINASQDYPDIAVHPNGDAIVAWNDRRDHQNVYYQKFTNIGSTSAFTAVGENTPISEETDYGYNIRVEMNQQEDFVIIFSKTISGTNDVFLKAFNSDGVAHSDIIYVSENTDREQNYPDLAFVGDNIYTTWQDNHELGVGYDIYANVFNWNDIVSGIKDRNSTVLNSYQLSQNYPNPFNPTTKINFTLPKESKVKIDIFNALGQKVSTLLNSKQTAGEHVVEFNGSNLTSGIYYYRIQAGNYNQVKKMILMK